VLNGLVDDCKLEVVVAGCEDGGFHFGAWRDSCELAELFFEIVAEKIEEEAFDAEMPEMLEAGLVLVE